MCAKSGGYGRPTRFRLGQACHIDGKPMTARFCWHLRHPPLARYPNVLNVRTLAPARRCWSVGISTNLRTRRVQHRIVRGQAKVWSKIGPPSARLDYKM